MKNKKKSKKRIVYEISVYPNLRSKEAEIKFERYKWKDKGFLSLTYWVENEKLKCFHGFITSKFLQKKLTNKQWMKFNGSQNQRVFKIVEK